MYDMNETYYCPNCGGVMQVLIPIWVPTDTYEFDSINAVWDLAGQDESDWYCPECDDNLYPAELDDAD